MKDPAPRCRTTPQLAAAAVICLVLSLTVEPASGVQRPALVNILDIEPEIVVDLPYASKNNFTGGQLYSQNVCLLRPGVAAAVAAAHREAAGMGYGLKILDCYRPRSVSMKMWKFGEERNAVCRAMGNACKAGDCDPARPDCLWEPLTNYLSRTSRHGTGASIDVTLMKNGRELDMGTPFDHFGPEARFSNATGKARERRFTLRNLLERHGFEMYFREWWHFDHRSWSKYERLDISFEEALGGGDDTGKQ